MLVCMARAALRAPDSPAALRLANAARDCASAGAPDGPASEAVRCAIVCVAGEIGRAGAAAGDGDAVRGAGALQLSLVRALRCAFLVPCCSYVHAQCPDADLGESLDSWRSWAVPPCTDVPEAVPIFVAFASGSPPAYPFYGGAERVPATEAAAVASCVRGTCEVVSSLLVQGVGCGGRSQVAVALVGIAQYLHYAGGSFTLWYSLAQAAQTDAKTFALALAAGYDAEWVQTVFAVADALDEARRRPHHSSC